jgi:hypothetical protein
MSRASPDGSSATSWKSSHNPPKHDPTAKAARLFAWPPFLAQRLPLHPIEYLRSNLRLSGSCRGCTVIESSNVSPHWVSAAIPSCHPDEGRIPSPQRVSRGDPPPLPPLTSTQSATSTQAALDHRDSLPSPSSVAIHGDLPPQDPILDQQPARQHKSRMRFTFSQRHPCSVAMMKVARLTVISRPGAALTSKRFCTRSPGLKTPGGVAYIPAWYDDQLRNSYHGDLARQRPHWWPQAILDYEHLNCTL